jgi:thiol:disulfide interchange protein DsbD
LLLKILVAAALCGADAPRALAAAHTQTRLLLAAESARPGEEVLAAIELRMDPGWHTYWRNPGAAGMATRIEWELPKGVEAGEIVWPLPQKTDEGDLTTYTYSNSAALLVPLKLAPDVAPGSVRLRARVSWLECKVLCVPGNADVDAVLTVDEVRKPSAHAALLAAWQKNLPGRGEGLNVRASWELPVNNANTRFLLLEWRSTPGVVAADFFPDASDSFEVQPATERIPSDPGAIRIRKEVKTLSGSWPASISGVLVEEHGSQRTGFEINLPLAGAGEAAASRSPGIVPLPPLWKMLVYAFIGGLILNIMPCVLPVIALKILGFVGQAQDDPRRVRFLGLMYAAGVLVSFLVLAGIVIGAKAAGHRIGWGAQFGNAQFLVVLTVLVTLIALNLFGLFELTLGGRAMNAAGALASRHGAMGAFFNGVLATALATPCTAPFLGAAVGFALAPAQTAPMTLAVFLTAGFGLAFPYVLLSWNPANLKWMPKPGAWMERLKVLMGFPMLAAAVWLFSLTLPFFGPRILWLGLYLVLVALAAWVYGEFVQRARRAKALAVAVSLVLLIGGFAYAIEGQLRWRSPLAENQSAGSLKEHPDGIDWRRWSPAALAQARSQQRPVLVDFTADWCLTCQANKKLALDVASVRAKLKEINAVALLADYTRLPDDITVELNRFGRAGVPLVLVYPRDPEKPPIVLPEALTAGIVLNALDQASK